MAESRACIYTSQRAGAVRGITKIHPELLMNNSHQAGEPALSGSFLPPILLHLWNYFTAIDAVFHYKKRQWASG